MRASSRAAATAKSAASVSLASMVATHYRVPSHVCFSTDQDGTAILNIERGKFHSLLGAGSIAWQQIAAHSNGATLDTIVNKLLTEETEFASEPREKVRQSVSRLLDTLMENGLVETSEHPSVRVFGGVRKFTCTATAGAVRRLTSLLIKWQLPRAAALLEFAMFQVIRWVGRFPARYYTVKRWPIESQQVVEQADIAQLCAAVDEAATWYPKESLCLQKASVTACLLRQYGIPAELKIGIHKLPFSGHAWVEVAGKVINDHRGVQKYFKVIDVW